MTRKRIGREGLLTAFSNQQLESMSGFGDGDDCVNHGLHAFDFRELKILHMIQVKPVGYLFSSDLCRLHTVLQMITELVGTFPNHLPDRSVSDTLGDTVPNVNQLVSGQNDLKGYLHLDSSECTHQFALLDELSWREMFLDHLEEFLNGMGQRFGVLLELRRIEADDCTVLKFLWMKIAFSSFSLGA